MRRSVFICFFAVYSAKTFIHTIAIAVAARCVPTLCGRLHSYTYCRSSLKFINALDLDTSIIYWTHISSMTQQWYDNCKIVRRYVVFLRRLEFCARACALFSLSLPLYLALSLSLCLSLGHGPRLWPCRRRMHQYMPPSGWMPEACVWLIDERSRTALYHQHWIWNAKYLTIQVGLLAVFGPPNGARVMAGRWSIHEALAALTCSYVKAVK